MATQSPSNRAALRALFVVLLAALVLAMSLPDIRRVWQPEGELGYVLKGLRVVTVDSHSTADEAGLKIDDQIDRASLNRDSQVPVLTGNTSLPEQRVIVPVKRGTKKLYFAMIGSRTYHFRRGVCRSRCFCRTFLARGKRWLAKIDLSFGPICYARYIWTNHMGVLSYYSNTGSIVLDVLFSLLIATLGSGLFHRTIQFGSTNTVRKLRLAVDRQESSI